MIYIMTPCSRVGNLPKLKESIPQDCTWVVVFDKSVGNVDECLADHCINSENTGNFGNPLRNEFLDKYMEKFTEDDWVYILDDDNIIHPNWYTTIKGFFLNSDQNINFVNWGQVNRLPPAITPQVGNIDTACYMYKPKSFSEVRYEMDYTSDGIFAERIFELCKPTTIMEELCYYNFLDPETKKPVIQVRELDYSKMNPTLLQFLYQQEQESKKL